MRRNKVTSIESSIKENIVLAYQNRPKKFYMFRQGYRSELRENWRRQRSNGLDTARSRSSQILPVIVLGNDTETCECPEKWPNNAHCVILTYKCEAKWCQKHPWACYGERSWQHQDCARVFSLSQGASCQQ